MNNSFLKKSVVALLCLGFILAAAPLMSSAERRAPNAGVTRIFQLPSLLISSALPSLGSIIDPGSVSVTPAKSPSTGKVKPTDDIQIPKPGSGD